MAEGAKDQDPKLEILVREILEIRQKEPRANILVYTEYTTSQAAAAKVLRDAGVGEVLTMNSDDDTRARKKITNRFRQEDDLVLVSTDTAAEGLNLHEQCHNLIHLELPFNPNRLEQRNGRIDRYGQTVDPIVRYFFLRGTFEERILLRLISKYERQRARLTFVPNTLGLSVSGTIVTERLLTGLMDEDQNLFKQPEKSYEFGQTDEQEGADEATRELLVEIDRVLNGFDKTAKLHGWLGEAGLNAEERLMSEADKARETGDQIGAVDLAKFVTDAALLDRGNVRGNPTDEVFEVIPNSTWLHGVEDLPSYDPGTRSVLLTTRVEITKDKDKRPVGFLGRAHPFVRMALDKVRHLSFGADPGRVQDVRVSVVSADVPTPEILITFLGKVSSRAGREYERVIAVKVSMDGKVIFLDSPKGWLSLADPERAIKTSGVWEKHFASWAAPVVSQAADTALKGFSPIAEEFVRNRVRRFGGGAKEDQRVVSPKDPGDFRR